MRARRISKADGRFTHISNYGRKNIPDTIRAYVYDRDSYKCQYCGESFSTDYLSIDHLIPVSLGGRNHITNYVTCCRSCNSRKSNIPLLDFSKTICLNVHSLPIHGDQIIDNSGIPSEIKEIRRRIHNSVRLGNLIIGGKQFQKKFEREYRRSFWQTDVGKRLEMEFPELPGQVRIMIPEIRIIASDIKSYIILIELAKSANTRSLIGSSIKLGDVVQEKLEVIYKNADESLKKHIEQAKVRSNKKLRSLNM